MNLSNNVGLVFNLPHAAWVDQIMAARVEIDPMRAKLPVEITAAGSSGVGPFSEENELNALIDSIKRITRDFPPFDFRFTEVQSFGNEIFWLAPEPAESFVKFHSHLVNARIKFRATAYPVYTPHCTIAAVKSTGPEEHRNRLRRFPVPSERVAVTSVSFYSFDPETYDCAHLLQLTLGKA